MKGRFAPSPTGRMHLGNVYSALLSWLSVRSQGGAWVLRIEDIDPQRSRPAYAQQIKDDLRWLGLDWDEEYTQSQRFSLYEQYLRQLQATGLVYPCYCTRADIMATQAPHESDGRIVYAGTCRPQELRGVKRVEGVEGSIPRAFDSPIPRKIDSSKNRKIDASTPQRPPSLRLFVPDEDIAFTDAHYGPQSVNLATHCGDFVLRRADGAWAYQLAVVVDDALMGITEVVRGRDLLLSAPQQLYLYRLLGFPAPTFCHLPLLCNASGQRLCKRDKSLDLGELRQHHSAEALLGLLAFHAGLIDQPSPISAQSLIPLFSWAKVPCEDIIVSED